MEFSHSQWINAPLEQVWAVTLDVDRLPDLSPTTVVEVQRLNGAPLEVGHQVRIKQPRQPARIWTVHEVVAPRRFVWATSAGPLTMVAIHDLLEDDSRTLNTLVLDLSGPGSGLIGTLAGRSIHRALVNENAGFKRVCENAART